MIWDSDIYRCDKHTNVSVVGYKSEATELHHIKIVPLSYQSNCFAYESSNTESVSLRIKSHRSRFGGIANIELLPYESNPTEAESVHSVNSKYK